MTRNHEARGHGGTSGFRIIALDSIGSNHPEDTPTPSLVQAVETRQQLIQAWRRVLDLGERPGLELLLEIGRAHGVENDAVRRLLAYAELDPDLVRVFGGDRFPPAPLVAVAA